MKKRSKKKIWTAAAALVLILLIGLILRRHRLYPPAEHIIGEIGKSYEILGTGGVYLTVEDAEVLDEEKYHQISSENDFYPEIEKIIIHTVMNFENRSDEPKELQFSAFPVSFSAESNIAYPYDIYGDIYYNEEQNQWEGENANTNPLMPGEQRRIHHLTVFLEINSPEEVWENFSLNQSFLTISYYPAHVKIRLGGTGNEGN